MKTPDLFPAELAAALAAAPATPPPVAAEPEPETHLSDSERYSEGPGYWLTWEEQYAREVRVPRVGPI